MKLTKSDREAFVQAVMDDVPQVDYDEQAKKHCIELCIERMPAPARAAYLDKESREYIETNYGWLPNGLNGHSLPCRPGTHFSDAVLDKLAAEKEKQQAQYDDLRLKLKVTIDSCSTLKQAKERLPEFEKYLPADRDGTGVSNLPAIANLVADLTRAGWPKGAKGAA